MDVPGWEALPIADLFADHRRGRCCCRQPRGVVPRPRRSIITRVLLERLVDELDDLDRIAWADGELNCNDLPGRVSDAMLLATTTVDELSL